MSESSINARKRNPFSANESLDVPLVRGLIGQGELRALFAACGAHPLGLLLKLIFASGKKCSVVSALRARDLGSDGHPNGLLPPGSLSQDIRFALLRLASGRAPDACLFTSGEGAKAPTEKTIARFLQKMCVIASQEGARINVTLKGLRDNFALYGLKHGTDPSLLMRQMSYKSGKSMHRLRVALEKGGRDFPSPLDLLERRRA